MDYHPLCVWELCESLCLYLPPSLSLPFHHSFSTSISVCFTPHRRLRLGPFCVCLSFCYRVSFVLLFSKLTLDVSHLRSPRLSSCLSRSLSLFFPSFVMWAMVDDCALGDLLLDPVSVRCGDERKAMKEGWRWEGGERERGRSRWKIERYTGRWRRERGEGNGIWGRGAKKRGMRKRKLCRAASSDIENGGQSEREAMFLKRPLNIVWQDRSMLPYFPHLNINTSPDTNKWILSVPGETRIHTDRETNFSFFVPRLKKKKSEEDLLSNILV